MVSFAAVIALGVFAFDIKASPEVICCADSVVAGRVTTEALTAATKFATVPGRVGTPPTCGWGQATPLTNAGVVTTKSLLVPHKILCLL